jgi:hypothetical protein
MMEEFQTAVEKKPSQRLYWCGGEPSDVENTLGQSMARIIELGYAERSIWHTI